MPKFRRLRCSFPCIVLTRLRYLGTLCKGLPDHTDCKRCEVQELNSNKVCESEQQLVVRAPTPVTMLTAMRVVSALISGDCSVKLISSSGIFSSTRTFWIGLSPPPSNGRYVVSRRCIFRQII